MKKVLILCLVLTTFSFAQKKDSKPVVNDSLRVVSSVAILENLNATITQKQNELKTHAEESRKLEQEILYLTGQRDIVNMLKSTTDSLTVRIK